MGMLAEGLAVVCVEAVEPELVDWLRSKGIRAIPVPYSDAMQMGTNVVALGKERVLVPASSKNLVAACRAEGLTVYDPDVSMIGNGGGAVHCMCQALRRDRVRCPLIFRGVRFVLGTTATVAMSAAGAERRRSSGGSAARRRTVQSGRSGGSRAYVAGIRHVRALRGGSAGTLPRDPHSLNAFITLEPAHVLEDARARDRERLAGSKAGSTVRPSHTGQGQRQHTRLSDHRRHACAAAFSPTEDAPVVAGTAGRRRRRARQDQSARTLLRLDQ